MKSKARSDIRRFPGTPLILFACVSLFAAQAMAQQSNDAKTGLRDALWLCLREKVPGVERSFDGGTAFDPNTGRNFAYDDDKHAWIDTKTLECICPKCLPGASDAKNGRRDALWLCLREKVPGVQRSFDGGTAFDPNTGRNFAYNDDKHAWIDTKTLECICPKCPQTGTVKPPPSIVPSDDYRRACDLFLGYSHNRVDTGGGHDGFNGFEVAIGCPIQRYVDITGDYTFNTRSDSSGSVDSKATIHQLLGGVTFQDNATEGSNVRPFAHLLAGITHHRFSTDNGTIRTSGTATGFAGAFGGGVDVRINKRVSWRAFQIDYNPNHVNDTWQHNFRLSTGLVLRLGKN